MNINFLDSYKFLLTSLSGMVDTLQAEDFQMIRKFFRDEDQRELVKRKGVFPYGWFDDFRKLESKELPPIEKFYSMLNEKGISRADYEHAKKVWETFDMNEFREYHDLYLKTDVLLLADVFEKFRRVCLDACKLNPAHYYTSPSLTWDAFFKMSKAKPELFHDYDMYLVIERGVRGGVAVCTRRYAKANNKYLKKYDKKSNFLKYWDTNNLYGAAMSRKMPYSDFRWLNQDWLDSIERKLKRGEKTPIPCILEVDLEYPKRLHIDHNDFPLAPENRKIGKVKKLVCTLEHKEKYVIHYKNLEYYLKKGMRLTKIHRAISFEERAIMKEHIDFNTRMRTNATTDFEKNFYKLMNNALFGKTLENVRNRVNIQLVTTDKDFLKRSKRINYKDRQIFSERLKREYDTTNQYIWGFRSWNCRS